MDNKDNLISIFNLTNSIMSKFNNEYYLVLYAKVDKKQSSAKSYIIESRGDEPSPTYNNIPIDTFDSLNRNENDSNDKSISIPSDNLLGRGDFFKETKYIQYTPKPIDKDGVTFEFVIQIHNVDKEIQKIFNEFSGVSFLRLILSYFFENVLRAPQTNFDDTNIREVNTSSLNILNTVLRLFAEKLLEYSKNICDYKSIEKDSSDYNFLSGDLIDKIDDLSNKRHEGVNPFGSIVLLPKCKDNSSESIDYAIEFNDTNKVELKNTDRIRKLLETTNENENLVLVTDGSIVYGLGKINWLKLKKQYIFKFELKGLSKYEIKMLYLEQHQQSISHRDGLDIYNEESVVSTKSLLKISHKRPHANSDIYSMDIAENALKNEFQLNGDHDSLKYLLNVIEISTKQKHGTMVVVTDPDTAIAEVKRLRNRSTIVKTKKISDEYFKFVTSIDGAVYLDTTGDCHAIGVILDGMIHESDEIGDPARGARYNSAIIYQSNMVKKEKKCVVIVISEDGAINVFPRPLNGKYLWREFVEFKKRISEDSKNSIDEIDEQFRIFCSKFQEIPCHVYVDLVVEIATELLNKTSYSFPGTEEDMKYYKKANDFFEEVLSSQTRYSKDVVVLRKYGTALLGTEQYDMSIEKFKESYDIDKHPTSLNYLGIAYNEKSINDKENMSTYAEKAIEYYTKTIESTYKGDVNLTKALATYNRALTYEALKKHDEALDDFVCVLLNPYYKDDKEIIFEIITQIIDTANISLEGSVDKIQELLKGYDGENIQWGKKVLDKLLSKKDLSYNGGIQVSVEEN